MPSTRSTPAADVGALRPDVPVSPQGPSAFDLPVQQLVLQCRARAPLCYPPREGASVGTTLAGAFGRAFPSVACRRVQQGRRPCRPPPHRGDGCAEADRCPLLRLHRPHGLVARRSFCTPILLHAPALESGAPRRDFDLEVTLWGRRAVRARPGVLRIVDRMGRAGVHSLGSRVRFSVMEHASSPVRSIGDWAPDFARRIAGGGVVVFETPTFHQETHRDAQGRRHRLFTAGGAPPFEGLFGNAAHDLTSWDFEDRDVGRRVPREEREQLAERARRAAREAARAIRVRDTGLEGVDLGERWSRSTNSHFPLRGFVGAVSTDELPDAAAPWLAALVLGGAGQHRAMGFGRVRVRPAKPAPLDGRYAGC